MSITNNEHSISLGQKALGYIKYNNSAAKPEDYEIWFNFASGLNPELNSRIKELLSQNPRISQDQLDQLYTDFFLTTDIGEQIEEIGSKVSLELDDIMEIVSSSLANTESYSESLEVFTSELNDIDDTGSLKMMISTMAAATIEMAQNTKELETNLQKSHQHITKLNKNIESIRDESMTDALTGIANRKKFDTTIEKQVTLARADGTPFSLLLADIDHFKSFNDTYGHQTGDQVLRLVGSIMKHNVKGKDLAARYGGEEFAILLPNTGLKNAREVAEQIRKAVASKELVKKSTGATLGRVTMSIGVAELTEGDTIPTMIARADKALYAAKAAGRNNVQLGEIASKDGEPEEFVTNATQQPEPQATDKATEGETQNNTRATSHGHDENIMVPDSEEYTAA